MGRGLSQKGGSCNSLPLPSELVYLRSHQDCWLTPALEYWHFHLLSHFLGSRVAAWGKLQPKNATSAWSLLLIFILLSWARKPGGNPHVSFLNLEPFLSIYHPALFFLGIKSPPQIGYPSLKEREQEKATGPPSLKPQTLIGSLRVFTHFLPEVSSLSLIFSGGREDISNAPCSGSFVTVCKRAILKGCIC